MRRDPADRGRRVADLGVEGAERRDDELEGRLDLRLRASLGARTRATRRGSRTTCREVAAGRASRPRPAGRPVSSSEGSSETKRDGELARQVTGGRRSAGRAGRAPRRRPRCRGRRGTAPPRMVFGSASWRSARKRKSLVDDEAESRARQPPGAPIRSSPPARLRAAGRPAGEGARHLDHVVLACSRRRPPGCGARAARGRSSR